MGSIFNSRDGQMAGGEPCTELLEKCLLGESWPDGLLDRALAVDDGRAFLSIVVERLGDVFDPRLCDVYDRLFSDAITRVAPHLKPRIRTTPDRATAPSSVDRVYVLSRVTLGADVAVTSVLLDAAKRHYPGADISFVGSRKSYELFEADPRVRHFPAPYTRSGSLADRLAASASLWFDDGIVIDPDSRLTQLGLLSVCPERNYFHFPSRSCGFRLFGCGNEGHDGSAHPSRLPDLASAWARDTFGVEGAQPYIAPYSSHDAPADITVSLGVGENHSKRIEGNFEQDLLRMLAGTGKSILVDKGGDAAERQRVEAVLVPGMRTHEGAFAPFAAQIARSKLFVGYDSAGGHVASACGVPLISIGRGFVNDRMAARWRPNGNVIDGSAPDVFDQIQRALPF